MLVQLAFLAAFSPFQSLDAALAAGGASPGALHWLDLDRDGDLDALAIEADGSLRFLRQEPARSFVDATAEAGLAEARHVRALLAGDVDGDGKPELVLGGAHGLALLQQLKGCVFEDATLASGLAQAGEVRALGWIDVDADARADLHVVGSASHRVFRNEGAGSFVALEEFEIARAPTTELAPHASTTSREEPEAASDVDAARTESDARGERSADRAQPDRALPPRGDVTSSGGSGPDFSGTPVPGTSCMPSIEDMALPGSCLSASSVPQMGLLYPMSNSLNVDPTTGWVAINTDTPDTRLHVMGQGRFQGSSEATGGLGTGMLQVISFDATTGLGIDADELQTWGTELLLNPAGPHGTRINESLFVLPGGRVGVGTVMPSAGLHVESIDGLLATGALNQGTLPIEGPGTRMLWYPKKAAFRAGHVQDDEWDDANVGNFSIAMGDSTKASGLISTAMGAGTTASADYSTAMGRWTTASGEYSTAAGAITRAQSLASFALGIANLGGGDPEYWILTDPLFEIGNGNVQKRANALTVLKNGNVGITTATPAAPLHVQSPITTGNLIQAQATGTTGSAVAVYGEASGDGTPIGVRGSAPSNGYSGFFSGRNYFGSAGVGVQNPEAPLHVQSPITTGNLIQAQATGSTGSAVAVYAEASGDGTPIGVRGVAPSNGYSSFFAGRNYLGIAGVGVQDPQVPLHVDGGNEVVLGSGGELVLGLTSGPNVALDEDELQARNNGAAAVLSLNPAGGNVGIGLSAPTAKLDVAGNVSIGSSSSTSTSLKLRTSAAGTWQLLQSGQDLALGSDYSNNTDLFLDRDRGVGIRRSNVQATLDVQAAAPGDILRVRDTTTRVRMLVDQTGRVAINRTSASDMLDVNGNVRCIQLIETSDARLKRDVRELEDALATVLELRGVSFAWDRAQLPDADEGRQLGFLAQEVRAIVPEAVREAADGTLSVTYSSLVPVLAEGVSELHAKVVELEQRLAHERRERELLASRIARIDALLASEGR